MADKPKKKESVSDSSRESQETPLPDVSFPHSPNPPRTSPTARTSNRQPANTFDEPVCLLSLSPPFLEPQCGTLETGTGPRPSALTGKYLQTWMLDLQPWDNDGRSIETFCLLGLVEGKGSKRLAVLDLNQQVGGS
ncbi:UNVERIFIED_CONTAM: hypothetical protein FKN15_036724 [Acipenser sinensis]